MERRRAEREREVESDVRDRQKEKEELEELRNKIFAEGHSDPSATFEKVQFFCLLCKGWKPAEGTLPVLAVWR